MMKYLVFLLCMYSSYQSIACSCLPPKAITEKEIQKHAASFVGKVIQVDTLEDEQVLLATFKIKTRLKGVSGKSTIQIKTAMNGAMCGLGFKEGQKWFVFANEYKGVLSAGMCGRSTLLSRTTRPKYRTDRKAIRQYMKRNK